MYSFAPKTSNGIFTSPGRIAFDIGARMSIENPLIKSFTVMTKSALMSTFRTVIFIQLQIFSHTNVMNNTANLLNQNALSNVELANNLANTNSAIAEKAVNVANKTVLLANNIKGAQLTANAAVNEAVKINLNNTSGATEVAARVAKAAVDMANNLNNKGAAAVANIAVNAASNAKKGDDPNAVALNIANAANAKANKVESIEVKKVNDMNTALNNSIAHSNATKNAKNMSTKNTNAVRGLNSMVNGKYANVKKATGSNVITAQGVTRPRTNANALTTIPSHKNGYAPANANNQKTGKQMYKEGVLMNIYKNKNGKQYTVQKGLNGNMKNYLFSGINMGLFSNKMV